jgi:hypothetical protein
MGVPVSLPNPNYLLKSTNPDLLSIGQDGTVTAKNTSGGTEITLSVSDTVVNETEDKIKLRVSERWEVEIEQSSSGLITPSLVDDVGVRFVVPEPSTRLVWSSTTSILESVTPSGDVTLVKRVRFQLESVSSQDCFWEPSEALVKEKEFRTVVLATTTKEPLTTAVTCTCSTSNLPVFTKAVIACDDESDDASIWSYWFWRWFWM